MKRLLFITPVSPFESRSGSEQRSALMLNSLRLIGLVDVLILSPASETTISLARDGRSVCINATIAKADGIFFRLTPKKHFTQQLEQKLGHSLGAYDLIIGRYVWGICQLCIPETVKVLVDLDDFRFRFSDQYGWSIASFIERARKYVGHMLSRRALKRFSGAFVASARDLEEISSVSDIRTSFLPNVAPDFFDESPEISETPIHGQVLFVGSLWYGPNAQSIDWFLREVWTNVRSRVNNATLVLIGAVPAKSKLRWEAYPGVSVPGFVDNLTHAYAQSAAVVVPIQAGGGSNIKVLEAIWHMRPCIVSKFVSSAFEPHLQPFVHFRVAGTPEQFSDQVCEVIQNDCTLIDKQYILHAKSAISENFSSSAFTVRVQIFSLEILNASTTVYK